MTATPIQSPYPQFFDRDGLPLDSGKIYIGKASTNPAIATNQIPIYWDSAFTQPAPQPLITSKGVIYRNGTPANIFVKEDYSISVYDKSSRLIVYLQIADNVLSSPSGSSSIGFIQYGTGAVQRTVEDELRDTFSVAQFGGVPGEDCAQALVLASAATTGTIVIPNGAWVATLTTSNSETILGLLKSRICIEGTLALTPVSGTHNFTSPIVVSSENVSGLSIVGASPAQFSITGQVSVSGTPGSYFVVWSVSTTNGISVGDYIHTTDVVGTGVPEIHRGMWEVTAIDSVLGRVTVRNTCWLSSFPTNTITSSNSYALKTILKFNSCDGFVVRGSRVDFLNNVAIVGNSDSYWNSSNVTGTEKGTHGIYVGAMTIAVNGKSDNTNQYGVSLGHVSCGPMVGVNGFDQQGICVELSGTFWGDFVSSSNNKRRGFYATTAAGIRAKHISANGNFLDGVITDIGGEIYASSVSCSCGNGSNGITASSSGGVIFDTGIASANVLDGFSVVSGAYLQNTLSKATANGGNGISGQYGGVAYCNNSTFDGNGSNGLHAQLGSLFRATNCTLTNNGAFGLRADDRAMVNYQGSAISGNTSGNLSLRGGAQIQNGSSYFGGTVYGDSLRARNLSTSNGVQIATGTGGDTVIFGFDTTASNTYTTGYNLVNNSNGFYPAADNANGLGRASNRWTTVFAGNGAINTSDGREKTAPEQITDAVLDAWGDVQYEAYQWLEAIATKGKDMARWHFGVIAQSIRDAFEARGLDGTRYGLLCYDEWDDTYEPVLATRFDKLTGEQEVYETGEQRLVLAAGNRWGIRPDQCLFLEAAFQRRRCERIEERLNALEARA